MASETADRLAYLKSLRLKIMAALDGSVDKAGTASYNISDSDGSQSLTRRSPKELMDMLDRTDTQIAELERRLSGGGIRTFGTRLRP
jgi:chromosome segregation ATPase